ncbi:MAG: hypothetical protein NVSMB51_20730 [Solirubrobacteraceae bacterium]
MRTRQELFAVALGGALGSLLRTGLVEAFPARDASWPWVTFAVNLAGAALLGFVSAHGAAERLRTRFIGTGFCGALTTFSAFQLELLRMLDRERLLPALLYAGLSLLGGLAGLRAGLRLAR